MNDCKSNQKSDETRTEGNEKFSHRSFFDAMAKYNESLCFAEPGTANLGLAYANRSAVYFENKLYEKCIKNIKLARENHYPEKNLEVLKKREDKSTEAMKRQRDESTTPVRSPLKLTGPANKNIPFISDCLELKSDKKFGRYIVTNRYLKVGDVLAIEEPFSKILKGKFIYQRCASCFKDNLLDLIPCRGCIKGLLYLSKFHANNLLYFQQCFAVRNV